MFSREWSEGPRERRQPAPCVAVVVCFALNVQIIPNGLSFPVRGLLKGGDVRVAAEGGDIVSSATRPCDCAPVGCRFCCERKDF